jgi:predicted GNAT family N-acyltransferase
MDGRSCVIDGTLVAVRATACMEDTLQAFALRAACFIGEQDRSFFEEFDGHDHDATHLIATLGNEPIGTVRLRWFKSFATPDRLAVVQRCRGQSVGALLLERARAVAESRGSRMLYVRATASWAHYFERLGWRRLEETPGANATLALVRPTDSTAAQAGFDALETDDLFVQYAGDTVVTSPAGPRFSVQR